MVLVVHADVGCESRLVRLLDGGPVVLQAKFVAASRLLIGQVADAQTPRLVPWQPICESLESVPAIHGALSNRSGRILLRKLDLGLRREVAGSRLQCTIGPEQLVVRALHYHPRPRLPLVACYIEEPGGGGDVTLAGAGPNGGLTEVPSTLLVGVGLAELEPLLQLPVPQVQVVVILIYVNVI